MLIYIHGFNSSARSYKARLFAARMAEIGHSDDFECPELPPEPREAIGVLEERVRAAHPERVALVGSSLGGFYATWLCEKFRMRAVLINPAVRPYELLQQALGRQTNLYTGEQYDFTETHLAQLRALEVNGVTPAQYLLITRTGDEVLDYRDAVERYGGCEQIVVEGGDHGFADFGDYLDTALVFCGVLTR